MFYWHSKDFHASFHQSKKGFKAIDTNNIKKFIQTSLNIKAKLGKTFESKNQPNLNKNKYIYS